jgi:hypothetical protein
MNRRGFLYGAGLCSVLEVPAFNSISLFAQSSGPNAAVYTSAIAANCQAIGDALENNVNSIGVTGGSRFSSSDWLAVANSLSAVMSDWKSNNADSQLRPYYQQMSPSRIMSSNINLTAILEQVQQYNPSATFEQIQSTCNYLNAQPISNIQNVLDNLVENGLYPYLQQAQQTISRYAEEGFSVQANLADSSFLSVGEIPGSHIAAMEGIAGGIPSGCTTSNGLAVALGTAFGVIAIMAALPEFLAYATVWGLVSLWGEA